MRTRGKTRRSPRGKHPAKPSTSAFWPLGLRDASGPQSGPPGAPRAGAAEQKRHRLAPARVLSGGSGARIAAVDAHAPAGVSSCRGCCVPRRSRMPHLPLSPPSSSHPRAAASKAGHLGAILLSPESCQQQRERRRGQRGGPPATRRSPARLAFGSPASALRPPLKLLLAYSDAILKLAFSSRLFRFVLFSLSFSFVCELFEIVFISQIFGDD